MKVKVKYTITQIIVTKEVYSYVIRRMQIICRTAVFMSGCLIRFDEVKLVVKELCDFGPGLKYEHKILLQNSLAENNI